MKHLCRLHLQQWLRSKTSKNFWDDPFHFLP